MVCGLMFQNEIINISTVILQLYYNIIVILIIFLFYNNSIIAI